MIRLDMSTSSWTYGAEHELGDWDRRVGPPAMMGVDERDVTVMNSDGIAADPTGRMWPWGGEINTAPTSTPAGQGEELQRILELHPGVAVNHRSNLHIHVRIPGLADDLEALKRIAAFGQRVLPRVLQAIEPLPRPADDGSPEAAGALRRWRRRRVSHQTVLTGQREQLRQGATTPAEFHALTAPQLRGVPQHHLQPREAVNLRQLMQTDTIEFRHFPGTLDPDLVTLATRWCRTYLVYALQDLDVSCVALAQATGQVIPWPEYVHWREVRYRATCHDGTLGRAEIATNIERIERGEFDDHPGPLPR